MGRQSERLRSVCVCARACVRVCVCACVCVCVCLPACLSACLPVSLSLCLSVCLSLFVALVSQSSGKEAAGVGQIRAGVHCGDRYEEHDGGQSGAPEADRANGR